jgi:hypothetical protein
MNIEVPSNEIDFSLLAEPFEPKDIEWRIERCGEKNGQPWAMVLAYVTNRAIMQRLDDVCKPWNWRNEYITAPTKGTLCGLSIKYQGEWITKYDGSDNTNIEAVKGGLSGAMKRAAVQWGIGRYLYKLTSTFAVIVESNGQHYQPRSKPEAKSQHRAFYWNEPQLPIWALPSRRAE